MALIKSIYRSNVHIILNQITNVARLELSCFFFFLDIVCATDFYHDHLRITLYSRALSSIVETIKGIGSCAYFYSRFTHTYAFVYIYTLSPIVIIAPFSFLFFSFLFFFVVKEKERNPHQSTNHTLLPPSRPHIRQPPQHHRPTLVLPPIRLQHDPKQRLGMRVRRAERALEHVQIDRPVFFLRRLRGEAEVYEDD